MTELSAYAAGVSRTTIETALRAAGKDLSALDPVDLAPVEDFHTLGRYATAQLADLAEVQHHDRVLDAGTGLGGTARYLASTHRCHVTGIDQSAQYCDAARWLNETVGLGDLITITQGDITSLPFPNGAAHPSRGHATPAG